MGEGSKELWSATLGLSQLRWKFWHFSSLCLPKISGTRVDRSHILPGASVNCAGSNITSFSLQRWVHWFTPDCPNLFSLSNLQSQGYQQNYLLKFHITQRWWTRLTVFLRKSLQFWHYWPIISRHQLRICLLHCVPDQIYKQHIPCHRFWPGSLPENVSNCDI